MFKVSQKDAFVEVSLLPPIHSISLKLDHEKLQIKKKLKKVIGIEVPSVESAAKEGQLTLCWVSNDELLLLNESQRNDDLLNKIRQELGKTHSLVEDVTDMRAWFLLKGKKCKDLLRKGVPIDLCNDKVSSRNFFRSRIGEVQVNILIKSDDQIVVSVLRSLQDYARQWFDQCSSKGTEVIFDL